MHEQPAMTFWSIYEDWEQTDTSDDERVIRRWLAENLRELRRAYGNHNFNHRVRQNSTESYREMCRRGGKNSGRSRHVFSKHDGVDALHTTSVPPLAAPSSV